MNNNIISRIILANKDVQGAFRYKDKFQVYPLTLEGKPDNDQVQHYPLVLEFLLESAKEKETILQFPDDSKMSMAVKQLQIKGANIFETSQRYLNLLFIATGTRFFTYPLFNAYWGIPAKQLNFNQSKSEWMLQAYMFPGMDNKNGERSDFSDLGSYGYLSTKDNFDYDVASTTDKTFILPSSFYLVLDGYFKLNQREQYKIDSALRLLTSANELAFSNPSLAFVAAISALETIMNLENKRLKQSREFCAHCGQLKMQISNSFLSFIDRHIALSETHRKLFKNLYNVRSKIVHEGQLLLGEIEHIYSKPTKKQQQSVDAEKMVSLTKSIIAHWLTRQ